MMHIQYELENFTVKQKSRICVLLDSMFKHLLFNILLMDFFFQIIEKDLEKIKVNVSNLAQLCQNLTEESEENQKNVQNVISGIEQK